MTTPLPQTPGDRREDHAQAIADTVAAVFAQAELVLIATVAALARRVAGGVMMPAVAQRRLDQAAGVVFGSAAPRIRTALETGMASGPHVAQLAALLDQAADTAIAAARDALTAAVQAAGPVAEAAPGASLSLSRIQAAQKVLDGLGVLGVTGFVDRAGRRWGLTAYAEMATRTAVSNAWDDLRTAAMVRSGLDLIQVYTHSLEGSCEQCRPWLGRILSLTGTTPGHPTLAQAKAAGFRHPNCRCSWAAVGSGVAVISPAELARAAAAYRASQKQRALERRVRAAHRRTASAITPAARSKGRRDLAAARATAERMTQVSVSRRQHPFRAR